MTEHQYNNNKAINIYRGRLGPNKIHFRVTRGSDLGSIVGGSFDTYKGVHKHAVINIKDGKLDLTSWMEGRVFITDGNLGTVEVLEHATDVSPIVQMCQMHQDYVANLTNHEKMNQYS